MKIIGPKSMITDNLSKYNINVGEGFILYKYFFFLNYNSVTFYRI